MKRSNLSPSSKFRLCALTLALVAGSSAYADTTLSGAINPGAATDTTTGSTPASGAAGIGSFTINQYNGGGVLTGASFSATYAPESILFSSTGTNGGQGSAYGYGVGTLTLGVPATDIIGTATSSTVAADGVHLDHPKAGTIGSYTVAGSATTQEQLNALYGSGTVAGSVSERLYSNLTNQNGAVQALTVDNTANRNASVTYSYTSLNHANGAFDTISENNSLTLSFHDIANGVSPSAYGFSLYNLANSYGLQVVSITQTSGNGVFSLSGIGLGGNLAGGSALSGGSVSMVGQQTASFYTGAWDIVVADSADGIGAGKNLIGTDTLHLYADANVLAAPVPEPESYAMLLAGLGLIGTITIRRRNHNNG
jgi:hypothetical protein